MLCISLSYNDTHHHILYDLDSTSTMFDHLIGLLTEILWRGDLQEITEGFRYSENIVLRLLTENDRLIFGIKPKKEQNYYTIIEVKDDENSWEILEAVLTSLHLLKNSMVFYESIHYRGPEGPSWIRPTLDAPNIAFMHALSLEELEKSRDIFYQLQKMDAKKHSPLKIACDRISRIITSKFVGDQLIDACIGYEALFFEGQQSGGNRGLAIAIACSMLIGETYEERKKIKEVIVSGFKLRNKIMHGSDYTGEPIIKTKYAFIDYLKQSIVKLLFQLK